jgi:DNA-nicking Smr family endonuclease
MSADDLQRRKLSEEEHTLWHRITRSIVPLRRRPRLTEPADAVVVPSKAKPMPSAPARASVRHAAPAPKPPPALEPMGRRQKQRLARGIDQIDAHIDLHGKTQHEAHAALLAFLRNAQARGARFVLVITGKGTRAGDDWSERGVLKRQVPLWLKLPEFRAYVVGFEAAHVGHGGLGALYVRLRRGRHG